MLKHQKEQAGYNGYGALLYYLELIMHSASFVYKMHKPTIDWKEQPLFFNRDYFYLFI